MEQLSVAKGNYDRRRHDYDADADSKPDRRALYRLWRADARGYPVHDTDGCDFLLPAEKLYGRYYGSSQIRDGSFQKALFQKVL